MTTYSVSAPTDLIECPVQIEARTAREAALEFARRLWGDGHGGTKFTASLVGKEDAGRRYVIRGAGMGDVPFGHVSVA